jgi:hypothetical protein
MHFPKISNWLTCCISAQRDEEIEMGLPRARAEAINNLRPALNINETSALIQKRSVTQTTYSATGTDSLSKIFVENKRPTVTRSGFIPFYTDVVTPPCSAEEIAVIKDKYADYRKRIEEHECEERLTKFEDRLKSWEMIELSIAAGGTDADIFNRMIDKQTEGGFTLSAVVHSIESGSGVRNSTEALAAVKESVATLHSYIEAYTLQRAREILANKEPCFEASVRNLSDDYAEQLMKEVN